MQIDHDPKEYRFTKGDQVFISVATAIVLILAGLGLKWVANNYGLGWLAVTVAVEMAIIFPLAFWLERRR
ncbi:hypothetical protein G6M16_008690 [Agrobacterium tumefaciens]|nr:hypothetical protein G6M16_008690 [Agrobacterium tumefaciens]